MVGDKASKSMIAGAILVLIVILIALYYAVSGRAEPQAKQDAATAETLESSLDAATNASVSIPSTNPAREALPAVDPLEKTNPFRNAYENPFE